MFVICFLFRSDACEQDLFTYLEDMDWSKVTLAEGDDFLDAVQASDFHDIAESSFHGDQSLLENLDALDCTESPGPSFAWNSTVQVGGGRNDFNIRVLKEKALKTMGVKEVSYELTFNDHLFHEQKKMNEVFDLFREVFQKMLDQVKRDFILEISSVWPFTTKDLTYRCSFPSVQWKT